MKAVSWHGRKYTSEGFLPENNSFQSYFGSADNTTPCSAGDRKRSTCWDQHSDQLHQSASILKSQICLYFFRRPPSRCSPDQQICLAQHSSTHASRLRPKGRTAVLCSLTLQRTPLSWQNPSCTSAHSWGAKEAAANSLSEPLSQTQCFGGILKVATGCSHLPGQGGSQQPYEKPPVLAHKKPRAALHSEDQDPSIFPYPKHNLSLSQEHFLPSLPMLVSISQTGNPVPGLNPCSCASLDCTGNATILPAL